MRKSEILLLATLILFLGCYGMVKAGTFGLGSERVVGSGNVIEEEREISGVSSVSLATSGVMNVTFGDREELIIRAEDNLMQYIEVENKNGNLFIDIKDGYHLKQKEKIEYMLTVPSLEGVRLMSSGDINLPDVSEKEFWAEVMSSGDLTMDDLDTRVFELKIMSSGDVIIGDLKADKFEAEIMSSGDFEAMIVDVPEVDLVLLSSGDVHIKNLDADILEAQLASSGDLKIDRGNVDSQKLSLMSSGDFMGKGLVSRLAKVEISSAGDAYLNVSESLDARTFSSGSVHYSGNPKVSMKTSSSGKVRKMD